MQFWKEKLVLWKSICYHDGLYLGGIKNLGTKIEKNNNHNLGTKIEKNNNHNLGTKIEKNNNHIMVVVYLPIVSFLFLHSFVN